MPLVFIATLIARAADARMSADVMVSNTGEDERPYTRVKIGVLNSKSLPDYTNETFNKMASEIVEKNSAQGVSFSEGVLTFATGTGKAALSEKKSPVEPAKAIPAVEPAASKKTSKKEDKPA